MPTMEKEHMYLTTSEVAEELRISAVTVQKLLATGELRGTRVGKVWRIKRVDLHEYLDRHTNTRREA